LTAPFYIFLPSEITPIPDEIQNDSKFYPFFTGALGGIDGTYIKCCPSVLEQQSSWCDAASRFLPLEFPVQTNTDGAF